MKFVGFAQLRNELKNGNILNWYKSLEFCDKIYVWDQASDDDSCDFYDLHRDKLFVIRNSTNEFKNENICKKKLLQVLLENESDADWIMHLDGDTILDGRLSENKNCLETLCSEAVGKGVDAISFGHYNLWRSDNWYRVDNDYHWLHGHGRCWLWKKNNNLIFPPSPGLHTTRDYPNPIKNIQRSKYDLVHRGFATDQQILNRYNLYKSLGQSGRSLDRLIDESGLMTEPLPSEVIPTWYKIENPVRPESKTRLING